MGLRERLVKAAEAPSTPKCDVIESQRVAHRQRVYRNFFIRFEKDAMATASHRRICYPVDIHDIDDIYRRLEKEGFDVYLKESPGGYHELYIEW